MHRPPAWLVFSGTMLEFMIRCSLRSHFRVVEKFQWEGGLHRSPGHLYILTWLSPVPKAKHDSSLNTTFCRFVTFHFALAWYHCRQSRWYFGFKGSSRKEHLDCRFVSASHLEIICGTTSSSTSVCIVERVHCENHEGLLHDPSILSPHCSRSSSPDVGTISPSLL
ncbi:hypothetical protein TNCV_2507731 [Trichonephila clavipes]|nr:hypothetical protein TNCV_2507731 [Trichonephila clavipes]